MRFKASKGGPPPQKEPSVSFSELVAAHHRWADELHGPGVVRREVEEEYHKKLNAFERTHGEIFGAYWCRNDASAMALTVREKGALGAVVSVLSRMTRKGASFVIDHEIGKRGLHILGCYRPLIGAITGLAVYFLARAELIQIGQITKTIDLYVVLAFLAGFSERWAQVLLTGAEKTISGPLGTQAGKADAAGEQPRG